MVLKTAYEAAVERTAHIPPQEPPKPYEPPPAPKTFEEFIRTAPAFDWDGMFQCWKAASLAERVRCAESVQRLATYPCPPVAGIGREITWPEFIAALIRAGAEE